MKYNVTGAFFALKEGCQLEISNEKTSENLNKLGFKFSPEKDASGAGPERSRSSLGFEYEAQVQVIKQKHGNLEVIRHRLGLSRRKICQILMVDPSAWTRWTKEGEDAPPHIYRSLEWYLLLQEKYPGMDSPFWLEAVSRPNTFKAETAALRKEIGAGVQMLDQKLDQKLGGLQRKLRRTQIWLVGMVAASSLALGLMSCSTVSGPTNKSTFVANANIHEVLMPDKEIREIAQKYAPILIHEVGTDPQGDLITNFDYDNDWIGDNNWKNLEKFELNPSIYFEVTSTPSHYFITYAAYHPRDYSWVCMPIICHENDMEGVIVVVDRATKKWIYTESIAHNFILSQENSQQTERPTLMIEWGGHGIYPPADYKTSRPTKVFNPQMYGLEPIAKLWNLQFKENHLFEGAFNYEGDRYRIAGVPLAFLGRKWTNDGANAPWAWTDWKQGTRGDIFFDPAGYVSRKHPGSRMSMDYDRNPYINLPVKN